MEKTITTGRPQRNRRHSRRAWPPEDDLHHPRAAKRLFTPEIKRMLKDWLIRRRENPYPSRDEKKRLAIETGLTYTQICNWFANWRRKLKNSERERAKKSWGHLIKHYNTNARGNVEQFSISSEDSIWEEQEERAGGKFTSDADESHDDEEGSSGGMEQEGIGGRIRGGGERKYDYNDAIFNNRTHYYGETTIKMEPSSCSSNYYTVVGVDDNEPPTAQCYQISTVQGAVPIKDYIHGENYTTNSLENTFSSNNKAKYKQKMMEKYLRDTQQVGGDCVVNETTSDVIAVTPTSPDIGGAAELSKWLESAAKFTPDKNNYYVEWNNRRNKLVKKQRPRQPQNHITIISEAHANAAAQDHIYETIHHKDELDAAEALANLAFNCRQRMLGTTTTSICAAVNAISS